MCRVIPPKILVKFLFIGCCILVCIFIYNFSYSAVQAKVKLIRDHIGQLVPENVGHAGEVGRDIAQEFIILKEKPKHENDYKYILMWTHNHTVPFVSFPQGRIGFIDKNCQYTNCFISNDKKYFNSITEWDALLFHVAEYTLSGNSWHHPFPKVRSAHQEYILASIESSHYYPICDQKWNNYFNWTMTYKLDSDVPWEYFVIRNLTDNQIIGPGANVKWKENMTSLSEEKKQNLKKKTKAVSWWVSNCYSLSKREVYAGDLKKELEKLDMVLDVFGGCSRKVCDEATCDKKLQDEYLFYLSFENSFATDYTTEKFLNAMRNNAVPIVWGASNYSSAMQAKVKLKKDDIGQSVPENVGHAIEVGRDIAQEFVILKEKPKHENDYKYILMWTHNHTVPFVSFPQGRNGFIDKNCQCTNCFISNNKKYFNSITEWDALLFHVAEYTLSDNVWRHPFPKVRSAHQEYILASIESSDYYPICDEKWNNYFNWTMTYKLDSDVPWEYFDIRNLTDNQIIGPGANVQWKENMTSLSEEKKQNLKKKTKAVSWWVSNCYSLSKREVYVKDLKQELEKLDMVLDVFGGCSGKVCDEATCDKKLQDEYLFYLSFENSFAMDYTTEKFLNAMRNNAVPIVWGASDYSRFAPPNSYINAREMSAKDLASLLHRLVNNIDEYAEYLKWQQYYSYHSVYDSYETHPLCKLCKALNDPLMTDTPRVRGDIRSWWNGEENKNC